MKKNKIVIIIAIIVILVIAGIIAYKKNNQDILPDNIGGLYYNTNDGKVYTPKDEKYDNEIFNKKFLKYTGTMSGSAIKSLIQEVMMHNNSDEIYDNETISIIGIVTLKSGKNEQPDYGELKNAGKYEVEITNYRDGYISEITITKKEEE